MILAFFLRWLTKIGDPQKAAIRSITIAAVILLLAGTEAVATRRFLRCWRESIGLFEHMLSLTPNSPIVCYNFGNALSDQNKIDEAIEFYRRALKIRPDFADARNNLGTMYETQGKLLRPSTVIFRPSSSSPTVPRFTTISPTPSSRWGTLTVPSVIIATP
jgi:tetratricopeptide (TPR) repeat protein